MDPVTVLIHSVGRPRRIILKALIRGGGAMKRDCTGRGRCGRSALIWSLLWWGLHMSDAVLAQEQSTAARGETSEQLGEVVVTAQRRTENLQDVPISAQVIGGSYLAQQNYNSLNELTATIPAVTVSSGGFSNNFFIRGIGSGANNPSYDQSVSTFIDDVYFGRSRMSEGLFLDLDRIEVLKGPQSTFFGNNAIAGALNIVTRKPGDKFDASGRVLY